MLFSPAFRLQRHKHGLTLEHRGMLLCDAFTGGHAQALGQGARRERWAEAMNIHLPEAQPGGWSAKGQPCDKLPLAKPIGKP